MNKLQKVLIIEDSTEIIEAISFTIGIRWQKAKILSTGSGIKALAIVEKENPDIVILDLGLHDMSGFEVLKRIRVFSQVPVIILTVRSDEEDIVKGIEFGANDYIVKPFRQMELLSRIHNQIRGKSNEGNDSPLLEGSFQLHPVTREVIFGQKNIQLTPIESSLLSVLINNKGHVVTHVNLINEIWGSYDPDLVYSLKVHIRRLRQKLEKDPSNPTIILTKIGLGYYFKLPE